jgi:hypothetical protein
MGKSLTPGGPSRLSDHADPSAQHVAGRLTKTGRLFAASGAERAEPARRVTATDSTVCCFARLITDQVRNGETKIDVAAKFNTRVRATPLISAEATVGDLHG